MLYDPYSGETSNSLQDVMNGFRVITSGSISEDSVVIILKVRTRIGGGISTRMITNEKDETERGESKEPGNTESIIIGEEELEGFGRVLVKKDGCDDYSCSEVILKPSFTFEHFPNGTFNEDPCTVEQSKYTDTTVTGIFSPLWNRTIVTAIEYFKMENLSACFQPINGKWKFGTTLPLYPYYQAIMDVCLTNITNKGYRYLYDISEIQSVWNDANICNAKKDLEGHKQYPSKIRTGGYVFLEVEMAHEMAHGQDFQWVIDSLQNAFLYPTLDLLVVTCGDYDGENRKANNTDDAKLIYFNYLQKVVAGEKKNGQIIYKGFEDLLFEGYENHIKQSFIVDGKQVDHENYINSRPLVTNTINVLLSEFENIWNCN